MDSSSLDLQNPDAVADCFKRAADVCLNHPTRSGSVVDLPDVGRVVLTGDLHDNVGNFQRIMSLANLEADAGHHVVLHELIHGSSRINDCDLSIRLLARAADLMGRHPGQVHLIQSNHELAQLNGEGILKQGASVVEAFNRGVAFLYGDRGQQVVEAMNVLLRQLPLAIRCANGVLMSHSLPGPRKMEHFDTGLLDRAATADDLRPGGHAHNMVWGRNQNDTMADQLAQAWHVTQFVIGHQPAEMGYEIEGRRLLILASDHNHGVALPLDLSRRYDQEALVAAIQPLNAVAVKV